MDSTNVLFGLALVVACVSWTVTQEEVTADFRAWCKSFERCPSLLCHHWQCHAKCRLCNLVAYLPSCYYCFSHWVALVMLTVFPVFFLTDRWIGWVFAWFSVVFVANVYLSAFHVLRIVKRGLKAWADTLERRL